MVTRIVLFIVSFRAMHALVAILLFSVRAVTSVVPFARQTGKCSYKLYIFIYTFVFMKKNAFIVFDWLDVGPAIIGLVILALPVVMMMMRRLFVLS